MSVPTELARLNSAKVAIKTAINNKGGSLTNETISEYAAALDAIVINPYIRYSNNKIQVLTEDGRWIDVYYTDYLPVPILKWSDVKQKTWGNVKNNYTWGGLKAR